MAESETDTLDVTFTDDIPKIEREGFNRTSKYTPLIEACKSRPGKAARLVFDSQGKASSRASSIKQAASNDSDVKAGEGHFKVATRSGENEDGETEFYVYTQYLKGPEPEDDEDEGDNEGESSDEPKAKATPKKRPVKKAAKKSA